MSTLPILLGRRRTQDGSYEEQLRKGCEILIGGDTDNLSDFGRVVFTAPEGLESECLSFFCV